MMGKAARCAFGLAAIACCLFLVFPALSVPINASDSVAQGRVLVRGLSLQIDPPAQIVPLNTATLVNTVFNAGEAVLEAGSLVRGELRGPGINGALTLAALPGHPFTVPGLSRAGNYTLSDIRLESGGRVLLAAEPSQALIQVMEIIVTQVQTRPLSLDEIREKGIVITDDNFTYYNFSVGLLIGSDVVQFELPVVFTPQGMQVISDPGGSAGLGFGGWDREPFLLELDLPELELKDPIDNDQGFSGFIPGLLVFNNRIGFLNQFFSAMFIIANNAPEGSPLHLKDLQASLVLPDGLRETRTNPPRLAGTSIPVRCPGPDGIIGTADDLDLILAAFSGRAEFLAEGLKEGSHTLRIDFNGTLGGLPGGDLPLKGSAQGVVVVRNPSFAVTFAHPEVVRAGEEYDLYLTLTNTSTVNANLVSLQLPAARLIGTSLLSEERIEFETIPPGESGLAHFRLLSRQTGRVSASAFAAEGPVQGNIILSVGVGEQGIPLSPDTLVLPAYAYALPADLVEAALLLLGEAHSLAQAPAGSLPAHLPHIAKSTVQARARELIEAGQRIEYGDKLLDSLAVLLLDWLGSRFADLSFDSLRRLTSKGGRLAAAAAAVLNQALESRSLLELQRDLALASYCRSPFFSLALAAPAQLAELRLSDERGNRLGVFGADFLREIPQAEFFALDGGQQAGSLVLFGRPPVNALKVEIFGRENGFFDLALVVPEAGGLVRVMFSAVECRPASLARLEYDQDSDSYLLYSDLDGDGNMDFSLPGQRTSLSRPQLRLLGAVQDCHAHGPGHAVALLFNQSLAGTGIKNPANYELAGKKVNSAFLQASGRVVIIGLDNPVSPFVDTLLKVSGLHDLAGGELVPAEIKVLSTIRVPGGLVSGTVSNASGRLLAGAQVRLASYDSGNSRILERLTVATARTDDDGRFQFDFVRMLPDPFEISIQDPLSGRVEKIRSSIRSHGQRLQLDIIMRGRASLAGRTLLAGAATPLPGVQVQARVQYGSEVESHQVRTDSAGNFLFPDLPLGRIDLFAFAGDLQGFQNAALANPGELVRVDVLLAPGQAGAVSGRVLAADGQSPLAVVEVRLKSNGHEFSSGLSDSQGYFSFARVPTGPFSLEAINPLSGRVGASSFGSVQANQMSVVNLIMAGGAAVGGRVQNHAGLPVQDAMVWLVNTPIHTQSDQAGEFLLENVPLGNYQVRAYDQALKLQAAASVKLISVGQEARVVLTLPDPAPLQGGVSGRVFEASGAPAGDADVFLADGNYIFRGQVRSSSDGSFAFSGLPPGHYILAARRGIDGGASWFSLQFPGHFRQQDIRFCGLGEVEVNTFAADGQTRVMADVEFNYSVIRIEEGDKVGICGESTRLSSGAGGRLLFNNVLAGSFGVRAANAFYPGGAYASGRVPVDGRVTVDLVFKPTGKVRGLVLAPDGENPVPGALVKLRAGELPEQVLTADEQGGFEFTLVPPGAFSVEAADQVNGYLGQRRGSMGIEGQIVEIDLRLKGRGEVHGLVRRQGEPVPAARVSVKSVGFPGEVFAALSDGEGRFRVAGVSEGDLVVEAEDPVSTLGGRSAGRLTGNNGSLAIDVDLEPAGTVQGRVLSVDGLQAVPSAQLVLYVQGRQEAFGYALSDSSGWFAFSFVPRGLFRLEVLEPASGRTARKNGQVGFDGETVELSIALEARGTVSGTFSAGSGLDPIGGARVTLESKGSFPYSTQTSTDEYGRFSFVQVSQGDFTVEARDAAALRSGRASGRIEYEEQAVLLDLRAVPGGVVQGRVLRSDGSTPLADALVKLADRQLRTDSSGFFRFEYVPLGSFSILAFDQNSLDRGQASGFLSFEDQQLEIEIICRGLGQVTGLVADANGIPLADIPVGLRFGQNGYLEYASNQSGIFSFPGIPLGGFELSARHPLNGLGAAAAGVLSTPGETVQVELVLEAAAGLRGRVLDPEGLNPAGQALVRLQHQGQTFLRAADSEGRFAFENLRLGIIGLQVEGFAGSGLFRTQVQLSSHGQLVDLGDIVLDGRPPLVSSVFPAHGAADLPLNSQVKVLFSEPMDSDSLGGAFSLSGGQGRISGSLVIDADGRGLSFSPQEPLPGFTACTVTVAATACDLAGNPLAEPFTSYFTTLDNVPPAVLAVEPAPNALQVPLSAVVKVVFSEVIDRSAFGSANIQLLRDGQPVSGTVSFNEVGDSAFFAPAALLSDSSYSLRVSAVRDLAGNVQAAPYVSVFQTIDTLPPGLELLPPPAGTTVKEGSSQKVTALVTDSGDLANLYFFINGELRKTLTKAPFEYSFTAPDIAALGQDSFLLEALAVDRAGNQSPRRQLSFTLLPDLPPQVSFSGPADPLVRPGQLVTCPLQAHDDLALRQVVFRARGGGLDFQSVKDINLASFSHDFSFTVPAEIAPDSLITLSAEATDSRGTRVQAENRYLQVPPDDLPPEVRIISPAAGTAFDFNDVVLIRAEASDDLGLRQLRFFRDGDLLAVLSAPPWQCSYPAPALEQDTLQLIRVEAEDVSGKTAFDEVSITVRKLVDPEAPQVRIIAPVDGAPVFPGENLKILVQAEDDQGIDRVELLVNDELYSSLEQEPYEFAWTVPSGLTDGTTIRLTARAVDLSAKSAVHEINLQVLEGVLIPAGTVIEADDQSYDGRSVIISNGAVTINGRHVFLNMIVSQNGTVNHGPATVSATRRSDILVSGKLRIDASSALNVNGRGYLGGGRGDNNSVSGRTLGNVPGSGAGSGGSYGGYGGQNASNAVNELYGSLYLPADPGSGGGWTGTGSGYWGGSGGGVLQLEAGELFLEGGIYANGGAGANYGGGGGSGGSVLLRVGLLSGAGRISANGGSSLSNAAGGGGGRIALYYGQADAFNLSNIEAYGGMSGTGGTAGRNGGAGTVYLQRGETQGELIVDNRGLAAAAGSSLTASPAGTITALYPDRLVDANAAFTPGALVGMLLYPNMAEQRSFRIRANTATEIFTLASDGDLTQFAAVGDRYDFRHGAQLVFANGLVRLHGSHAFPGLRLQNAELLVNGRLEVAGDLVLQDASRLSHDPASIAAVNALQVKAGRVLIDASSALNVNGRGYLGGGRGDNNSASGRTLGNVPGSGAGSGGSYGGYGGQNASNAVNELYGSLYLPADPGSGGGRTGTDSGYRGGSGGGVLQLEAGELFLEGGIYADGGAGDNYGGGGGSGGSVLLRVGLLSGAGRISANGGSSLSNAAGGGGGRIALYYGQADAFNLSNIEAYGGMSGTGGTAGRNGGAGTVYLQRGETQGELIVDNRGLAAGNPILFPVIAADQVLELGANNLVSVNGGYTVNALAGMELIPDLDKPGTAFPIIANTHDTIYIDPLAGDLREHSAAGRSFAGRMFFPGRLVLRNTVSVINGGIRLQDLELRGQARLSHPAADSAKVHQLAILASGRVLIDASSALNVNGRGYLGGGRGDNNSASGRTLGNVPGSGAGSGGSYGGYGGQNASNAVNELYGSLYLPADPGSGGGWTSTGSGYRGGSGGGVLQLEAGELFLEGGIYADGGAGDNYGGGGGSGGSVLLRVGLLSGAGRISANGGSSLSNAAGGGGGRIALYYGQADAFNLSNIEAYGGMSGTGGTAGRNGGAGTVYLQRGENQGELIVDNNDTPTPSNAYSTVLPAAGHGFSTGLEPFRLHNINAAFIPGALAGLRLNPFPAGDRCFSIIGNDARTLQTDPADGDLTLYAQPGQPYIGEHHLLHLRVRGRARLFTLDRVKVGGEIEVSPGSALKAENEER